MAKRDVIKYYLQVQNQYFEMLENVKDFQKELKGNRLEEEQLQQLQQELEVIKNNYERLSYIVLLLNKPRKTDKQAREEKENMTWYNYLKGSSKEAILQEDRDALKDFKDYVKEILKDK